MSHTNLARLLPSSNTPAPPRYGTVPGPDPRQATPLAQTGQTALLPTSPPRHAPSPPGTVAVYCPADSDRAPRVLSPDTACRLAYREMLGALPWHLRPDLGRPDLGRSGR